MNFGRYETRRRIGHGGMGAVYHAWDPQFERDVAIKVLPPILLDSETTRRRFKREARALAQLEHSAIVPVYDFGEEDGQPYLVMRHMRGGSLHNRIAYSPLAPEEAITILDRIASALAVAHQRGIVHRDIKPSNILFDDHDTAYLADFGIAKWLSGETQLTGNRPIGTPAYMSPEQIQPQGDTIDGRADVYALTAVLYQMLTGDPPFQTDTAAQMLFAHLQTPVPDLTETAPHLPPALSAVIERGMAKSAADRYPTTTDLAAAARAATAERPPAPTQTLEPVQTPKPDGRRWLVGAAVALLLLLATAAWRLFAPAETATPISPIDGMALQFIPGGTFETGTSEEQLAAICPAWEAAWEAACNAPTDRIMQQSIVEDLTGTLPDKQLAAVCSTWDADICNAPALVDNVPQQQKTVADFWIDQTEVTNQQYRRCVEDETSEKRCTQPGELLYFDDPDYAKHPVVHVTQLQANEYCAWAGRELPTIAQWRKAAYGEAQTLFAWGNTFDCREGNLTGCVGDTTGVGSYQMTPFDMSGNVWEWTRDQLSDEIIADWQHNTDRTPEDLIDDHYFFLGGSYKSEFRFMIPAIPHGPSGSHSDYVGFRCVSPTAP